MYFIDTYALKSLIEFDLAPPFEGKIVRQLSDILASQVLLHLKRSERASPLGVDFTTLALKAQGRDEALLQSATARQKTWEALCLSMQKKDALVMLSRFRTSADATLDSSSESEEGREDGCGPGTVV
jgi:hypothetical protein